MERAMAPLSMCPMQAPTTIIQPQPPSGAAARFTGMLTATTLRAATRQPARSATRSQRGDSHAVTGFILHGLVRNWLMPHGFWPRLFSWECVGFLPGWTPQSCFAPPLPEAEPALCGISEFGYRGDVEMMFRRIGWNGSVTYPKRWMCDVILT